MSDYTIGSIKYVGNSTTPKSHTEGEGYDDLYLHEHPLIKEFREREFWNRRADLMTCSKEILVDMVMGLQDQLRSATDKLNEGSPDDRPTDEQINFREHSRSIAKQGLHMRYER